MIDIQNLKMINKGAVEASFDICIPKWAGLKIRNVTLMSSNGKRWVSMPSRTYDDPDNPGRKKYYAYVRFEDKDTNQKFNDSVVKALDAHVKTLAPEVAKPPLQKDMFEDDGLPF